MTIIKTLYSKNIGVYNHAALFSRITTKTGRPMHTSINVASDIFHSFKPIPMKGKNGKLSGKYIFNFEGRMPYFEYEYFAEKYNTSHNTIRKAIANIEKHYPIKRQYVSKIINGKVFSNMMHIAICPDFFFQVYGIKFEDVIQTKEKHEIVGISDKSSTPLMLQKKKINSTFKKHSKKSKSNNSDDSDDSDNNNDTDNNTGYSSNSCSSESSNSDSTEEYKELIGYKRKVPDVYNKNIIKDNIKFRSTKSTFFKKNSDDSSVDSTEYKSDSSDSFANSAGIDEKKEKKGSFENSNEQSDQTEQEIQLCQSCKNKNSNKEAKETIKSSEKHITDDPPKQESKTSVFSRMDRACKDLAYYMQNLTDSIVLKLQKLSCRDFNLHAIKEEIKSLINKGYKPKFASIKGFLAYMAKVLSNEMRETTVMNNETFTPKVNIPKEELEIQEQERFLEKIETEEQGRGETSNFKRKIAYSLPRKIAYEFLKQLSSIKLNGTVLEFKMRQKVDLNDDMKRRIKEVAAWCFIGNIGELQFTSVYKKLKKSQETDSDNDSNSKSDESNEPEVWSNLRSQIQKYYGSAIEEVWFRKRVTYDIDESTKQITLHAGTFAKDWIESNYISTIRHFARDLGYKIGFDSGYIGF